MSKEFDKWKLKYCNENCTVLNNCDKCGGCLEFEIAVKAWKAALEWVLGLPLEEHNYDTIINERGVK